MFFTLPLSAPATAVNGMNPASSGPGNLPEQENVSHGSVAHALYKVVKRLGFGAKLGWITCDNASNNILMLREFECLINASEMRKHCSKMWDWEPSHIRCLAHVINLATQAILSRYSTTKHFDPAQPEAHKPDVGPVQAITAKACSSLKRKEIIATLQRQLGIVQTLVLLLDMKVCWFSTLVMLQRAVKLKQFINDFIYELLREEPDMQKCRKIDALILTNAEWKHVNMVIKILGIIDSAQQAFSYDNTPTLHSALPALEALHKAWSRYADKVDYVMFADALAAGADKINTYYEKMATSHAYTFAMLLNPNMKMEYFEKHWPKELQNKVLKSAEELFKQHHLKMFANAAPPKKV